MGQAMKLYRRQFLRLTAGAAALPAVSRFAWAQAYPTRPVRIIVGFSAGGPTDIVARVMAQWLSERLGQQFVVENRPGAASNIGTEAALTSPCWRRMRAGTSPILGDRGFNCWRYVNFCPTFRLLRGTPHSLRAGCSTQGNLILPTSTLRR